MTYEDKKRMDELLKNPDQPVRTIAYYRVFASIAGGALPGLFLSQCYFWTRITTDDEGWIYKSREEWEAETGLTRSQQETAQRILIEHGLLETEQRGGTDRRLYYRLTEKFVDDVEIMCR